jgi:hypothetical protein
LASTFLKDPAELSYNYKPLDVLQLHLEKGRKVWRNNENVAKKAWILCSDAG